MCNSSHTYDEYVSSVGMYDSNIIYITIYIYNRFGLGMYVGQRRRTPSAY